MKNNEVYIDTTHDTKGVENGAKKINKIVKQITDKVKTSVKSASDSLKKLVVFSNKNFSFKFDDIGKSLNKGLRNIFKYTLGIKSLFVLVNKLRRSLADGFNNLVLFNNGLNSNNTALSNIITSLSQLKNSFATAFSPILTVVEPYLVRFVDRISEAVTYIGMLIASLSGQSAFTKAIRVQEDYAKSLSNTAKNAKKVQQYLSGLDEIKTFTKKDDSNQGGINPNQMFETVQIDSKIVDFANKIKEAWGDGGVAGVFKALKLIWDQLPDSAKKIISVVGILWTVFKGAKILLGVISLFNQIVSIASLFNSSFGGIALVIGGAFLAVFNFIKMWNNGFSMANEVLMILGLTLAGIGAVILGAPALVTAIVTSIIAIISTLVILLHDNWDEIVAGYKNISSKSKNFVDTLKNIFIAGLTFIKTLWNLSWKKLSDSTIGVFNSLLSKISLIINSIIEKVTEMASKVFSIVNSVANAIGSIASGSVGSGILSGIKGLNISTPNFSNIKIPKLATGMVVPRQAKEFGAILGDNNRETEIVSPLSTMKQAMIEALAEYGGGGNSSYQFVAQLNRRTLFDEFIEEAKLRQLQSGKNPLLLR